VTRFEVISQMAVGVDNIDLAAATGGASRRAHAWRTHRDHRRHGLGTARRRGSAPAGRGGSCRGRKVGPWDPGLLLGGDLHDTTFGIVGLGRIGAAVARRAAGFGMRVLYTGPSRKPLLESRLGVAFRTFADCWKSRTTS
jgi:glyoxylate reductase